MVVEQGRVDAVRAADVQDRGLWPAILVGRALGDFGKAGKGQEAAEDTLGVTGCLIPQRPQSTEVRPWVRLPVDVVETGHLRGRTRCVLVPSRRHQSASLGG